MKNLYTMRESRPGEWVRISSIQDPSVRTRALSLGIGEGSQALCLAHLPKGPSILRFGHQKVAFGFALSSHILIERIPRP